ncbi:MAG: hypothetical protein Q4D94_03260, partial [Bacillota bacterium]|nr:hypothetical protein [Bacillota bacterium]
MNRRNRLLVMAAGFLLSLYLFSAEEITVQAGEKENYDFLSTGIAEILDPSIVSSDTNVEEQTSLNINEKFEAERERMEEELTMANVQNALNIRAEASEESEKVGLLYKD